MGRETNVSQIGEQERKHDLLKKCVTEYILKENREGALTKHEQMMKNRLTKELHIHSYKQK